MEAPACNSENLKDLLLIYWCQIPQDTFRGLVESMPQQISAVWQHEGDPHGIRQGVLMLWLISVYRDCGNVIVYLR